MSGAHLVVAILAVSLAVASPWGILPAAVLLSLVIDDLTG